MFESFRNPLTTFPGWVNLKTRKKQTAPNKTAPGIDYPSVAYVPPVEEEKPNE